MKWHNEFNMKEEEKELIHSLKEDVLSLRKHNWYRLDKLSSDIEFRIKLIFWMLVTIAGLLLLTVIVLGKVEMCI